MTLTIADIAWPGPRPISFESKGKEGRLSAFVGRKEELIDLRRACQTYGVVELTAPSGVGKTSFLAGAKAYLEGRGSEVIVARRWSELIEEYKDLSTGDDPNDPLPLYCLALGLPICDDASQLRDAVKARDGETPLVCVFDQVEELLRYERDLGANLLELIGQTAASTWVPHVVAARTEFRDRLRPLEVQEAPTWHMLLSELSSHEVIREVIEEPVPEGVTLADGVVDRIVGWWKEARSPARRPDARDRASLGTSRYGLLHLQALLWGVQTWALASPRVDPRVLTVGDLEEFAGEVAARRGDSSGGALMEDALQTYIEFSVASHRSERWPNGPRLMLARAAGHLSSAGFKVAQPVSTLAARAIQEELGSSRSGLDGQLSFEIDEQVGREEAADFFVSRFQIDRAGVGRELTAKQVAEEMVGSLEGMLRSLAESQEDAPNLLRRYRHGGDSIYELVHDGVAPALTRWAESVLNDPIALLGGICVRRGEIFDHDLCAETFLDRGGDVKPYWSCARASELNGRIAGAIEGIGWHGLGVHHPDKADGDGPPEPVTIEDVIFEDCDFTGTLFKGVVFRNVRFERCEMRGVAMIMCRFEGVTFDRSRLVGAAINHSSFDDVCFDCGGEEGAMDYVAIEGARPGADVKIRRLGKTAGIFLVGLMGGSWRLEDVRLVHLALEKDKQLEQGGNFALQLGPRCKLDHLEIDLAKSSTNVDRREKVEIVNLTTDDPTIIPPDDAGDGGETSG